MTGTSIRTCVHEGQLHYTGTSSTKVWQSSMQKLVPQW
jgi:hypothetical protein